MKSLQHIVCVDDEEYIRDLVLIALEDDFRVNTFSSGLALMQAPPESLPDLLLLDVVMPVMDGPATLQALRRHAEFTNIPAIFMTAETRPENVQMLLNAGAIGVLSKPIDITTLGDDIQVLWAKAQTDQPSVRSS